MELTAAIEGLEALKEPCVVRLVTDSKYVSDGIIKGWAESWRRNNWIKSDKKPALNSDLWERLLGLLAKHDVKIRSSRKWSIRSGSGTATEPKRTQCYSL